MKSVLCPHCHKQLPKFPSRKGNCPFCSHTFFVRTDPETKEKVIVDEKGVKRIEKIYHKQSVENEFERKLQLHVGNYNSLHENVKNKLIKRFSKVPSRKDILWGISNQIILDTDDFNVLKMVYFEQALFLYQSGKDYFYVKQLSSDIELQEYTKSGIKEVGIMTTKESCDSCKKLSGKRFVISEALKQHPLPNQRCSFKLDKLSPYGWCRCLYSPIIG